VDPFTGGRLLSIDDCKRIVRETSQGKLAWRDTHLAPSSTSQIVERVLANLVQAHGRANDSMAMFRVLGFLVTLRPDVPSYSLKRAAAAEALGARGQAAHIYADVMRRYPGSEEASVAAERQRRTRAAHIWN
jgi:regulator of sirC expression with transglutaminase-like and TPR domain